MDFRRNIAQIRKVTALQRKANNLKKEINRKFYHNIARHEFMFVQNNYNHPKLHSIMCSARRHRRSIASNSARPLVRKLPIISITPQKLGAQNVAKVSSNNKSRVQVPTNNKHINNEWKVEAKKDILTFAYHYRKAIRTINELNRSKSAFPPIKVPKFDQTFKECQQRYLITDNSKNNNKPLTQPQIEIKKKQLPFLRQNNNIPKLINLHTSNNAPESIGWSEGRESVSTTPLKESKVYLKKSFIRVEEKQQTLDEVSSIQNLSFDGCEDPLAESPQVWNDRSLEEYEDSLNEGNCGGFLKYEIVDGRDVSLKKWKTIELTNKMSSDSLQSSKESSEKGVRKVARQEIKFEAESIDRNLSGTNHFSLTSKHLNFIQTDQNNKFFDEDKRIDDQSPKKSPSVFNEDRFKISKEECAESIKKFEKATNYLSPPARSNPNIESLSNSIGSLSNSIDKPTSNANINNLLSKMSSLSISRSPSSLKREGNRKKEFYIGKSGGSSLVSSNNVIEQKSPLSNGGKDIKKENKDNYLKRNYKNSLSSLSSLTPDRESKKETFKDGDVFSIKKEITHNSSYNQKAIASSSMNDGKLSFDSLTSPSYQNNPDDGKDNEFKTSKNGSSSSTNESNLKSLNLSSQNARGGNFDDLSNLETVDDDNLLRLSSSDSNKQTDHHEQIINRLSPLTQITPKHKPFFKAPNSSTSSSNPIKEILRSTTVSPTKPTVYSLIETISSMESLDVSGKKDKKMSSSSSSLSSIASSKGTLKGIRSISSSSTSQSTSSKTSSSSKMKANNINKSKNWVGNKTGASSISEVSDADISEWKGSSFSSLPSSAKSFV